MAALSISQGDDVWKLPQPQTSLQAGDMLVIGGRPQDIEVLKGLRTLQIERRIDIDLEKLGRGSMQIIKDYFKQGLPISIIVLVFSIILLPVLFPYQ